MATIKNKDRNNAKLLIDDFLSDTTDPKIDSGGIELTDNICECEPLSNMIDSIIDNTADNKLSASFPFERYTKFDHNKLDHDFQISVRYKDRKSVGESIKKYSPVFSVANYLHSPHKLILSAILNDVLNEDTIFGRTYRSIPPKVSDVLQWLHTETLKIIPILRELHTDKIIKMIDGKSDNNSLYNLLQKVQASEKNNPDSIRVDVKLDTTKLFVNPGIGSAGVRQNIIDELLKYLNPPVKYVWGEPPEGNPGKGIKDGCDCSGLSYYLYHKYARMEIPRTARDQHSSSTKITQQSTLPGDIIFLDTTGISDNNTIPKTLKVTHLGIVTSAGCKSFIHAAGRPVYNNNIVSGNTGQLKYDTQVSWWKGRIVGYGRFLSEESSLPVSTVTPIDSAGFPDNLDESSISTMNFSISGNTSTGKSLETDIKQLLSKLDTEIKQVSVDIYRRALTKVYKSFVNDLTAKVEYISVNYAPGTSAYIPIAGEFAPVVQSTGGKIIQASIRLKEVKAVDVARLSTMFNISSSDDTIISMLMTARSIFKGGGDTTNRIKYLMLYAEEKKMEEIINELQGVSHLARFDEPVRITNDILNSLGLETFTPVSMELKTNETIAGAYDISIVFNYINLGQRVTESLKKLKGGIQAPIIPIACRLSKSPIDINELGDSSIDDTKFSFLHSISTASIHHGLSELLPLYVITRINDMICNILAIIEDKKIRGEPLTINSTDLEESLMLWSRKSKAKEWIRKNEKLRQQEYDNGNVGKEYPYGTKVTDTASIGASKWAKHGSEALLGAPAIGVALSTMKLTKKLSGGSASFSKWSKLFYACTQVGSVIFSTILGTSSNIDNPFATNSKGTQPKMLFFNILTYIPYMITDIMREYAYAICENRTDSFISGIAQDALDFFTKTKVLTEGNEELPARMYKFPEDITIIDYDNKEYSLGGIVVSMYSSGVNAKIKTDISIPFTNRTLLTTEEGIGLTDLSIKLANKLKKTTADNIKTGKFANATNPVNYASDTLMLHTIMSILNSNKINEVFGTKDGGIGNLETLCGHLLSSDSARLHAKQLVQSLFTSSFMDILASLSLTETNTSVITDIMDSQISKFRLYSESTATEPIMLVFKDRVETDIGTLINISDTILPDNKIKLEISVSDIIDTDEEIKNRVKDIWNELSENDYVQHNPLLVTIIDITEYTIAMVKMNKPIPDSLIGATHIISIIGTLQLSSTDINIAMTEVLTSHIEAFKQDILLGKEDIKSGAISQELLCGMFVDDTLTGNISKAYGQALLSLLIPVENEILSEPIVGETEQALRSIAKSLLGNVPMFQGMIDVDTHMAAEKTRNETVTAGHIARLIEPSTITLFSLTIENIIKLTVSVIVDFSLLILAEILLALATQGVSILKWIVNAAWSLYEIGAAAIAYFAEKGPDIVLTHGSIFILSHWLSGRLHDGLDSSTIVEICYKTGIWLPSALQYDKDVRDHQQTSYLDYPVVSYNSKDGMKPLAPDFYVYKIGFINESYKEMRRLIDTLNGVAEDTFNDNESADFEKYTNTIKDRTNGMFDGIRTTTEERIATPLFPEKVYHAKIIKNVPANRLFKTGPNNDYDYLKYAKIAQYIDDIYFDTVGEQPYNIVYISINSEDGAKYSHNSKRKAMIVLDLEFSKLSEYTDVIDPVVKIYNGDMFDVITKSDQYAEFTDGNFATRIRTSFDTVMRSKVSMSKIELIKFKDTLTEIITAIFDYSTNTKHFDKGVLEQINENMPKTLGNLMMAKSLVGSNIKAIGKPGMNLFKKELSSIGINTLLRSSAFRSGYFYPTIKLFFIEEDAEAWYLFDDLYSYASVVSAIVHMDKDSPIQTAIIKVTNLHNHLNNMMADRVNMEMNFVSAPDENSGINALMLQVGCKIKIQAGNTPILSESDTIFTGRINRLDFNQITTIEATSGGDVLTEAVSKNSYETFGDVSKLSRGLINPAKIASGIKSMAGAAADFNGTYIRPVHRIKDIASQVLMRITQVISTLADFTANPALQKQPEQELYVSYNSYMDSLKGGVVKELTGTALGVTGLTKEQVGYNHQLLENVNISGDRYWPMMDSPDKGAWVTFDETAWDILRELNLLLPNNILTVRPMDTRSTIVWGDNNGYYRIRRSIDIECVVANQLIYKIDPILSANQPKSLSVFNIIRKEINSERENTRAAGIALATLVSYYSQMIMGGMGFSIPENERVYIGQDTSIGRAIAWYDLEKNNTVEIEHMVKLAVGKMSELSAKAMDEIGDANAARLSQVTMKNIRDNLVMQDSGITELSVAKALCTEFACEIVLKYCREVAYSSSNSHRKISDYHIKISGRDIVSNDLQLTKPYNAVNLEFPKPGTDPDELLETSKGLTTGDNIEGTVTPHLAHYKLKPWAWKVYQSYFKNINVFSSARSSAISMAGASILTNLMKDTYQGTITTLGDSNIRENDKMLIWDETRDMYGIVGIKTHTFMFTPTEGCISTVVPEMVVRNEFNMQNSLFDSLLHGTRWIISTLLFGAAAWWLIRKGKSLHISTKLKLLRNQSSGLKFADKALDKVGKPFMQLEKVMPGFMKRFTGSKVTMQEVNSFLQEGKSVASRITNLSVKARKATEEVVISERNINEVLGTFNRVKGRLGIDKVHNRKTIEDMFINTMEEVITSKTTGAIRRLNGNQMEKLFESTLKTNITNELKGAMKGSKAQVNDLFNGQNGETSVNSAVTFVMGRISPSYLGKKIPGGEFNKSYVANINKIYDIKAGEGKSYQKMIDMVSNSIVGRKGSIISHLKKIAGFAIGYATVDWLTDTTRVFGEMLLLDLKTADNLVISPLFFRGEPLVAGLDGIEKLDGEHISNWDIMKSRFGDLVDVMGSAVTDTISQAYFDAAIEYNRFSEQNTAVNAGKYFKSGVE